MSTCRFAVPPARGHLSSLLATTALACALTVFPLIGESRAADPAGDAAPAAPAPADSGAGNVEQVTVTSQKSAVPDNIPAVVEGIDADTIAQGVNAMDSSEVVKYLPSVEVRERYIGDRNGIVATRTTGTVSSAESLVYADGLLLSNLLGNSYSYPPRWDMVSTNEIARVDMMYGPFSALYPGNSMGGVIIITTRMPDHTEAYADIKGAREHFDLYGTHEDNYSWDGNAALGSRVGNLSFWVDADHLAAQGHPMSFATANLSAGKAGASGPVVTGYYQDNDQNGNPRYVFGAYSNDFSIQDNTKLKLAYDLAPQVRATYTLGFWQLASDTSVQSYLQGANGAPVYNGNVTIGSHYYTVSGLEPGHAEALHMMNALSLKTDTGGVWDWEASGSLYTYLNDTSRTAADYGVNDTGTVQNMNGTGWGTAELRGTWRPEQSLAGRHEVTSGYHFDRYQLDQVTWNTAGWQTGSATGLNGVSVGTTQTNAVYVQDVWSFLPDWKLTAGAREEDWEAFGGRNQNATSNTAYSSEDELKFSPKASLSYQVTPALEDRFSVGKAYRFPTVTELFQSITSGTTITNNNPALVPESVWSYDWTNEYTFGQNRTRLSLFQEDRFNALFSQTNTTVTPNVTGYQNVNRVRIRGVETALHTKDLGIKGLDFDGSVTFADSRTLSDTNYPAAIGENWPRIPTWRLSGLATYHQTEDLSYSLGLRFATHAFSTLNNADVNHDVYGGISGYSVADMRVNYKLPKGVTLSAGVDNAFDDKYFVSPHPFPQTTLFSEVKYAY